MITHLHSEGGLKKGTNTRSQQTKRVVVTLKVGSGRIDVVGKEVVESIGSGEQKLDIWMVFRHCTEGLKRAALCEYVADRSMGF